MTSPFALALAAGLSCCIRSIEHRMIFWLSGQRPRDARGVRGMAVRALMVARLLVSLRIWSFSWLSVRTLIRSVRGSAIGACRLCIDCLRAGAVGI